MFDVEFRAISFRKGGKVVFFSHVTNRAADEVERGSFLQRDGDLVALEPAAKLPRFVVESAAELWYNMRYEKVRAEFEGGSGVVGWARFGDGAGVSCEEIWRGKCRGNYVSLWAEASAGDEVCQGACAALWDS